MAFLFSFNTNNIVIELREQYLLYNTCITSAMFEHYKEVSIQFVKESKSNNCCD